MNTAPCHCPAPGNEDLPCSGCEPTVTERLTARGLRLGDRVGTTKHDVVDGAGLVVFTGDAGQVAEWLDACTCSPCESGCDEACPTCCPPEPEQDEPVDESAEWRAHELAHAAGEV
jgi:hypothetical protein